MKSPRAFVDAPCISTYTKEDEAKFTAYLDIQLEEFEFLLPMEKDITDYIDDNIFRL